MSLFVAIDGYLCKIILNHGFWAIGLLIYLNGV